MSVDFSGSHKAMDPAAHEKTYAGFVKGTIYSTGLCVLILALMAIFLL